MKPDEIDEIWKRACAPLKDALAEVSYETWIATLKPIDAVGDRFLLEASTPFHRNMITSRYSELVRNALRAATRRDYELEVYLPGETAGDKRKPGPNPASAPTQTASIPSTRSIRS